MKKRKTEKNRLAVMKRAASVLAAMLLVLMTALQAPAYAGSSEPLREAHRVKVGNKNYCFFVKNNVVLTPEEIAECGTESELTALVISRAGLYMKETNCKKSSAGTITSDKWIESGHSFSLSDEDLDALRNASPSSGRTVKLIMDILVSTDPEPQQTEEDAEDETETDAEEPSGGSEETAGETGETDDPADDPEEPVDDRVFYSTYKNTGQPLIFAAVALEEDTGTEYVCEVSSKKSSKTSGGGRASAGGGSDTLPELRTIIMKDRSGPALEPVLEDGDAYSLEWIEPGRRTDPEGGGSLLDRIPGGLGGLAAMAAAAGIIVFILIRRKRESKD